MSDYFWKDVEESRQELGITKTALAVRSGIRENTIHNGIKNNRRLQPSTASLMRRTLDELAVEKKEREEAAQKKRMI